VQVNPRDYTFPDNITFAVRTRGERERERERQAERQKEQKKRKKEKRSVGASRRTAFT